MKHEDYHPPLPNTYPLCPPCIRLTHPPTPPLSDNDFLGDDLEEVVRGSPLFNDDPSDDDSADREFNMAMYGNEGPSPNLFTGEVDDSTEGGQIKIVQGPRSDRRFRHALRAHSSSGGRSDGLIRLNQLTLLQTVISILMLIIIVNTDDGTFGTPFFIMIGVTVTLWLATSVRWGRCPNPLERCCALRGEAKERNVKVRIQNDPTMHFNLTMPALKPPPHRSSNPWRWTGVTSSWGALGDRARTTRTMRSTSSKISGRGQSSAWRVLNIYLYQIITIFNDALSTLNFSPTA